jgi:hypothetical protein
VRIQGTAEQIRTRSSHCSRMGDDAHHLKVGEDGQRTLMVASIRYLDEFVKQNGQWFFAERRRRDHLLSAPPKVARHKYRSPGS